jgi:hypothetical protein
MIKMKKAISILGIAICASVLFFNVSINGKNCASNNDLTKIMTATEANAECWYDPMTPEFNHGNCNFLDQCYYDPEGWSCDWTQG